MFSRYPHLAAISGEMKAAFGLLVICFKTGHRVYVCGNGGSAADAQHIVGELMKSFVLKRPVNQQLADNLRSLYPDEANHLISHLQGALPAHALAGETALVTAFMNDVDPSMIYAQQLSGYMQSGDVLIAISTSGKSDNIIKALQVATAMGGKTISLTGAAGISKKAGSDVTLAVPETETYKVQEYHLPVYHTLCLMLENEFFTDGD